MLRELAVAAVACLLLGGRAAAQHAIEFLDGRTLEVESVTVEGGLVLLGLEGGGKISVPLDRIAHIEPITPTAPEPSTPAAVPTDDPEPWRLAAGPFAELIADAALRHDLDPALLTSMAHVESSLDPRAVSPKGAGGLLQLMPQTAKRFGVRDVFDASENVDGGARYLSWLLERYEGRAELALAGYNAGEGAVDRYRGIPPYAETRAYVTRVLEGASRLSR